MKSSKAIVVCCLAGTTAALWAGEAPLPAAESIGDGGYEKTFELSLDEIAATDPGGRRHLRKLAAKSNPAGIAKLSEQLEATTGEEASPVFYERGQEKKVGTRRLLTTGVLIKLARTTKSEDVARAANARLVWHPPFAPDYAVVEADHPAGAIALAGRLRRMPGVASAQPMLARQQTRRFVPNDKLFGKQWHLSNTGQLGGTAGIDVNPLQVWDTYRGAGVRIGIVDDGLQTTHPDLAPNVDTENDYDWNGADNNPDPSLFYDFHGTSCAGVAAACGNNKTGVSGAAPEATLVGLRLISDYASDLQEADAINYRPELIQIKSNSWGPDDDGKTLEGPGPLALAALKNACETGRGGLGTIFTWAGGNGGNEQDDSNKDGYANSIYTIAVGAVSDLGTKADYSEPGANLVISAPSSSRGRQGITTTDLVGARGYNTRGRSPEPYDTDYTGTFGGTSSATPLAAGVVALMLEANPNLGWRDVQEILIRSAAVCSPGDADWITNGAGLRFNHKFGAGLINAGAAVALAKTWVNLAPQVSTFSAQTGLGAAIPDNNATGITRTFNIIDDVRLEHVTLKLNISHPNRGDLEITLRSPAGTLSRLASRHNDTGDHYPDWTFMTMRNWGESSKGTWTLTIKDLRSKNAGTLKAATLTVFGTGSVTPPPPPPPTTTTTYTSADVPKDIPDNKAAGITSVNNVSDTGVIESMKASVSITHPYKGDLVVTLVSPTGTTATLHNRTGGSADSVILVDVPVTQFAGQSAAGQWKLKIQDLAAGDIGSLTSWSLTVTTASP